VAEPTDVTGWLLDSDPAIRWQVQRDLLDAPAQAIAEERARVPREGWGARLLALQGNDGQWDGGTFIPRWARERDEWPPEEGQPWTATYHSLLLLRHLGVDPSNPAVQHAVERVRAHSRWEHDNQAFFDGEVEPCINGSTVAIGAYFGQDVNGVVERLLGEQLEDGGWNCEAERGSVRSSFHTTISVLEGLLEWQRATGGSPNATTARERGEEYLLERGLMRGRRSGEVVRQAWLRFSFPPRWHYDVLRGLDHFRCVGGEPDPRCAEAIALVEARRGPDGRWPLENSHPGRIHFALEDGDGAPSRWNTLRALRVLRWASRPDPRSGT